VCSPELARSLTECASDTGRMVGVLCDRRGGVVEVALGEPTRLYLPDVGRLRAAGGRLRGLRLLVARPERNDGSFSLDHDLVTDLERLKLDCVLEIEALDDGRSGRCALATLLPSPMSSADGKREVRHEVESFAHVSAIAQDFDELIGELEGELVKTSERAQAAAKIPGEREVALLVGVYEKSVPRRESEASMEELKELARTAGVRVVDVVMQFRDALDGRTLVGKGKLEEVCLLALHRGAEMIIFDRDLSPSQLQAITDSTDLKVLDRTMLILDIFARRAKSRGGKLQVELAQLRYALPRLRERQSGMSRLTGGIGGQGPGETRLEIDRRRAKEKITRLEDQLTRYAGERELRRKTRNEKDIPVVALVGYTNAGKSSLLNALTGADVYAANELFATLDPTSRRLRFPEEREVVLIDTVGFIRDLPATLVHAFRATLEELKDADLLIHVVDGSDTRRDKQIEAVVHVLTELELEHTPRIVVLNKSDRSEEPQTEVGDAEARLRRAVRTSAVTRVGLDDLVVRMKSALWNEGHSWPDASARRVG
jgi:GTPase